MEDSDDYSSYGSAFKVSLSLEKTQAWDQWRQPLREHAWLSGPLLLNDLRSLVDLWVSYHTGDGSNIDRTAKAKTTENLVHLFFIIIQFFDGMDDDLQDRIRVLEQAYCDLAKHEVAHRAGLTAILLEMLCKLGVVEYRPSSDLSSKLFAADADVDTNEKQVLGSKFKSLLSQN